MGKASRRLWSRIRGSFGGRRSERRLAEEMEIHLEMLEDEHIRRGMPPAEARRAAMLAFGGLEVAKEDYRRQRGLPWVEILAQDLRYACRGMRRQPRFTAVAVLCLALGIGANTALFSVVNAVMLRWLPVRDPERLVLFQVTSRKSIPRQAFRTQSGMGNSSFPRRMLEELGSSAALSDLIGFAPMGFGNQSLTLAADGHAGVAGGEMVSGNYFRAVGVSPALGRPIVDSDLKPAAPNVAVISYGLWSRRFGNEVSVLGRSISINGNAFRIVGVAPPQFYGLNPDNAPDLWVPLRILPGLTPWGVPVDARVMEADQRWWWLMLVGRLRPGVTPEQAQAQVDARFQAALATGAEPLPGAEALPHVSFLPAGKGLDTLRARLSEPLRILVAATGLVLLIACANVAMLLLARAGSRRREVSVRLAIGASRGRMVRQFLTESVLLSCGGALAGLLLAAWGSRALLLLVERSGQPIPLSVRPDGAVLGFSFALALLTGIAFGLAPALRATEMQAATALKGGSAGRRFPLASALVVAQVAASALLLFGAGLFARTLANLEHQEIGFDRRNLLLFSLNGRRAGYGGARLVNVYGRVLEKLESLPGARSVTASGLALLSGWRNNSPITTDAAGFQPAQPERVNWNTVGPNFFETMGMPLVLGRGIEWRDLRGGRNVGVINEALAHRFFPGENPLGRHFSFAGRADAAREYEIIGVARDAKYEDLRSEPPRTAYVPYTSEISGLGKMCFEVRATGDPLALVPSIRDTLRSIDSDLPLMEVKTQNDMIEAGLMQERLFARLASFFGELALLLVAVGLYGVLAYAVARRTSEIGIRMALGARSFQVSWMVLRQSLAMIALGLAIGLPAACAAARLVAAQLFGVRTYDVVSMAGTVVALTAVGAAAGFLPARRASRVDPMTALRWE